MSKKVAIVHQYLKPDGTLGASGKPDPKLVVHQGKRYHLKARYELKQSVWPPYIQRLRHDGDIVPFQRSNAGKPGLYVVAGSTIAPDDGLKAQPDIAIDIMRELGKPMTVRDIINEFRKRGIAKESKISTLEGNLTRGLRRRPEAVHLRASKWRLNSAESEA